MAADVAGKPGLRIVVHAVGARHGAGAGFNRTLKMARAFPALAPWDEFLFVVRPELREDVQVLAPRATVLSPPTGLPTPLRIVWERSLLPWMLRRWRPDVVFGAYNLLPGWFGRGRPALVLMITNLLPFSQEKGSYGVRTGLALEALRRLTLRSIRRASLVLLLAPHARDLIGRELLEDKWTLLPPAVPAQAPARRERGSNDQPVFVVAADLNPYKSIETVIRAAAVADIGRLRVRVLGRRSDPRYARFLEAEIDRLGLGAVVLLEGRKNHGEVLAAMAACTASVAPSRFENLSHVLLESFAAGAPLLAADIPGVREVCGEAALYFPAGDETGLARLMEQIAHDPDLRIELSSRGTERLAAVGAADQSQAILDALVRVGRR